MGPSVTSAPGGVHVHSDPPVPSVRQSCAVTTVTAAGFWFGSAFDAGGDGVDDAAAVAAAGGAAVGGAGVGGAGDAVTLESPSSVAPDHGLMAMSATMAPIAARAAITRPRDDV